MSNLLLIENEINNTKSIIMYIIILINRIIIINY